MLRHQGDFTLLRHHCDDDDNVDDRYGKSSSNPILGHQDDFTLQSSDIKAMVMMMKTMKMMTMMMMLGSERQRFHYSECLLYLHKDRCKNQMIHCAEDNCNKICHKNIWKHWSPKHIVPLLVLLKESIPVWNQSAVAHHNKGVSSSHSEVSILGWLDWRGWY